jgi:hypothetical protein
VDEQRARLSRSHQHTLRREERTHVFDEEDGAPADLRAKVLDRELRPVLLHARLFQEHVVRERGPIPDARDLLARGVELGTIRSARTPIAGGAHLREALGERGLDGADGELVPRAGDVERHG